MIPALHAHLIAHPNLLPQDAVKFCYQSAFGGRHLITDHTRAAQYLAKERASLTPDPTLPLTESLGCGLVRLNLASSAAAALSDRSILRVFAASAEAVLVREDNSDRFEQLLSALTSYTSDGAAPFSADALNSYLRDYRASGCPMVSHTPEYRAAYTPAYRVIEERFVPLLPLIDRIEAALLAHPDRSVVIGIDGHAASGKTTCAGNLAALYDCNVFHMDDYFLPFDRRTEARLAEPGGNVDYERFYDEVLSSILAGNAVTYSAFDCQSGSFLPSVTVQPKSLVIVEGSYAHHPYFGDAYDLRIALDIPADEQRARILARNGERMLAMFISRWIPMEHRYFDTYSIYENADLILGSNTEKGDLS